MKQHTVTRAYLSDFTDASGREPYLWVYERGGDEPYRRAPHNVAAKSDYYSATVNGEREDVVEEVLSLIEGQALPVIRRLAGGGSPAGLSGDERSALAFFLGYLETRVTKFRGFIEKQTAELVRMAGRVAAEHPDYFARTMSEAMRAKGKEPPTDIEAVRQSVLSGNYDLVVNPVVSLQVMVALAPDIAEIVHGFEWRVLDAPDGEVFVTSDAPLVRVATERPPARWMGIGWESPWMEATFPLSPTTCLLISQHHPTGRESTTAERVREVNWRTAAYADREVYGSREIAMDQLNRPEDWDWWRPLSDAVLPRFTQLSGS